MTFTKFLSLKLALDAMPQARRFFADLKSDKVKIKFCPKLAGFYIEREGQRF